MAVVKINAIHVPQGAGPELEARFAARKHAVDNQPGFQGFQLLRPVKGDERYFVVTTWDTEEAFVAWRDGAAKEAHAGQPGNGNGNGPHGDGQPGEQRRPVASGADLLEFEVVDLD